MAGRKVRDRAEAEAALAAMAATGTTLARWARAHGLDGRSLNLWRLNLERRGGSRVSTYPGLRLVELVAESAPAPTYRVHAGSFTVEVADTFDEDVLRRLLRVVSSC
jgi:transposase-like protein